MIRRLSFRGVLLLAALAPARALTITTASLPPATVGASYSEQISISGQMGQRSWSVVGQLPPGLGLSGNSGNISGVPTQAGTYAFTVRVSDNSGSDSKALSITV